MKMKPIILLLTQLIIYIIASVSLACPPPDDPDCGTCQVPVGDECDWIPGSCMATGGCPSACESCDSTVTCKCQCAAKITTMGFWEAPNCPGKEVYFAVGPDSIKTCVRWSTTGGHPASQVGGCYFSTYWTTPGYHTVTARTCLSVEERTVYIGQSCPGVPAGCCLQENDHCCGGEVCCNDDEDCCTDSGSYCCEEGKDCCKGECCDPDTEHCCDDDCCPNHKCCVDDECIRGYCRPWCDIVFSGECYCYAFECGGSITETVVWYCQEHDGGCPSGTECMQTGTIKCYTIRTRYCIGDCLTSGSECELSGWTYQPKADRVLCGCCD